MKVESILWFCFSPVRVSVHRKASLIMRLSKPMHHMDDKFYASRKGSGNMLCKILILAVAVSLHPGFEKILTRGSSFFTI